MDTRIHHEHIANEAYSIYQLKHRDDAHANWQEAVENLKIFPSEMFDATRLSVNQATANCFGFITVWWYGTGDDHRTICFQACRELFERDLIERRAAANHSDHPYQFFIQPEEGQEYRAVNFIRDIELDRLHLSQLTTFKRVRTNPIHTDVPSGRIIMVRPSPFWTCCPMRFSLLTILFRAGKHYFYNTIEDALMSNDYSRTTYAAINLFFQGRRNYIGPPPLWNQKWVSHFLHLHESEVLDLAA